MAIDEFADLLREDPSDDSDQDAASGDEGRWTEARSRAEEAFQEIRWRTGWLGERYPLCFDGSEAVVWEDDRIASTIYRFLVLLRAKQLMGSVLDGGTPDPGLLFEEIVTEATLSYVTGGRAVRFGVAGGTRGGNLPLRLDEAIRELGREMNEEPVGTMTGQGDYRADVIAWKPFGDKRPGQLVVLSQATITEGRWQTKEIPARWRDGKGRLIKFIASPVPAVAFVETMSLYSSDFWRGAEFDSIPFDRLRLVSLLSDSNIEPELLKGIKEWSNWAQEQM